MLLEGEPVEDVPPYKRNVNTVFQSYALFEHLDVWATSPSASSARRSTRPGARVTALEQNTHRAEATDRWELGERVRVGWRREHGRVLR